jgi:lipoprotein-anchoring transpeptidase ErfK/SrfK
MSDVVPNGPARVAVRAWRPRGKRARIALVVGVGTLVGVTVLSACTSKSDNTAGPAPAAATPRAATSASTSKSAPAPRAVITTAPAVDTSAMSPAKPVTVAVSNGKLTSVTLVNTLGKSVKGTLSADGSSWRNAEVLGYGRTYHLTAVARNAAGVTVTKKSTYTTVTPGNMTMPYFQRTGEYALDDGATYGVGIVPVVHFDEAITDKKAAEQALVVSTSPKVVGSWNWVDDKSVHWRPQHFLKPGTRVRVTAKVYGVQVGQGLWGQADKSIAFKIGAQHIAVANAKTHQVKVYFDNKLVRTMPTSMGMGGYVQGKNGPIALWTMPGTYTVIAHENPASMSSDSYGLPASSPLGYAAEDVYWATKISVDGIYLHELDTTVWAQGHSNVSHGCLNLNLDNSRWYYKTALVGDVVEVVQSGGPALQVWQNGDWSVPWATWQRGSALH